MISRSLSTSGFFERSFVFLNRGESVLEIAIRQPCLPLVCFVLERGADPLQQSSRGSTLLELSLQCSTLHISLALISVAASRYPDQLTAVHKTAVQSLCSKYNDSQDRWHSIESCHVERLLQSESPLPCSTLPSVTLAQHACQPFISGSLESIQFCSMLSRPSLELMDRTIEILARQFE